MKLDLGRTQLIIRDAKAYGCSLKQTAYILATAYHETAFTMEPVRETRASTTGRAIAILDRAWAKGQLPWVKVPYWRPDEDGKSWLGRGFVQLTWKYNYEKASQELGVDLVSNPDNAMKPKIASQILVKGMMEGWFTSKPLTKYINETTTDYYKARRVVNGMDRASTIANYARQYEAALEKVW